MNNIKGGYIKKLKENKPLRYILSIVFFILLCCNLQSVLFIPLCLKEDFFRPPNTEVIVSACKQPIARGVPGGEVLFVHEIRTGEMYLLDLRTGEERKLPDDPLLLDRGVFLSSDLVWLEGSLVGPDNPNYRPHYILDLVDGKRYELFDLGMLPRLENGKFDPKNYIYFRSAQYIFLQHSENILIILSSDFRTNQNSRAIFSGYSIGTEDGKLIEELLRDIDVDYNIIDFSLQHASFPSPTGKYNVRNEGIFLSENNTLIMGQKHTNVKSMSGYFKGWVYDSSLIVQGSYKYLFSLPFGPRLFLVSQPILKLSLLGL